MVGAPVVTRLRECGALLASRKLSSMITTRETPIRRHCQDGDLAEDGEVSPVLAISPSYWHVFSAG